jgi:hypothetical protein
MGMPGLSIRHVMLYFVGVITILTMLLACGGDEPKDAGAVPDVVDSTAEQVDLPLLKVEYPARASFDTSSGGKISGQVAPGSAPISQVLVNGKPVPTENDGSFSKDMTWTPGIQIIGVRVEDEGGERAVDGRSFQAGPVNGPGAWLPGALRLEVNTDILDDDDPEIDDIAALIEAALEDPSTLDLMVGRELEASGFTVTPTRLDFAWADVDLVPGDGVLLVEVTLNEVDLDFDISGSGLFSWVSTTGTARVDEAQVGTEVSIWTSEGIIQTQPSWVEANLVGFEITVDWFPDGLEDDLAGWTEGLLEDTVVELATTIIDDTIATSLQAFVVELELGENLEMEASLGSIEIVRDAVRFEIDTRIEAIAGMEIPIAAGSLKTAGVAPDWPISDGARVGAAIDDDFLNQLTFAFWHSGLLKDVELPAIAIGGMAGTALPPPLGPADMVVLNLDLPPVITAPRDPAFDADMAFGEWRLRFERQDGEALELSVSLRTGIHADIPDAGELEVSLDDRPAHIDLEIGVLEAPEALDPGDLAALLRLMIPPLIGNSTDLVPTIPIPTVPVGELLDIPAAEGLEIGLTNPEMSFTEAGWLLLRADLTVD